MQLLKGITHLHKYLLALCNSTQIMYTATAINNLKPKTGIWQRKSSWQQQLARESQLAPGSVLLLLLVLVVGTSQTSPGSGESFPLGRSWCWWHQGTTILIPNASYSAPSLLCCSILELCCVVRLCYVSQCAT